METGTFTVRNTILAGSTSGGNCATMAPTSPMFTDGGYNIDDGTTCGFSAANHSQPGTNPDLDSGNLQNNGGPTQTIALQSDSPAINTIPAGVNSCGASVTSDQRGVARPQSANCDTGAFEASFITGYKFNDLNGNGQKDGGEPGLQGWTIRLEDTSNNVLSSTTTVAGGYYTLTISTLPATYRVREVQQPGWTQTSPNLADVPLTINTPGAGGEAIGNVFPADLSIVKSWAKSQTSALVGTYTLMVTNAGPNVAKNVVVTDPFPAQVALQSSTTSRGTCAYKLLSRTVTCKLGTMPVNATATIQLKVRVSNATGNFTNCASVASGTFDVNSNNNQSCVTLTPSLQQVTLAASDLSHALLAEVGAGGVGRLAGFVTMLLPGLTSWPVFST